MSLISPAFAVFFSALLTVYYIVPLKYRWWVLLAGSTVFYLLIATPYTIVYLLFSIVTVYCATKYIAKETDFRKKKIAYLCTLASNILLLVALKYLGGFWTTGIRILSFIDISLPAYTLNWLAPLGMSFYTLQLISYLTDVYWGISPAQQNFAKVALFASYFPSISSGPILRYHQVENTLFEGHRANYQDITFGLQRILWGLFKKMVIAERAAMIATPIFADSVNFTGIWIWLGLGAAVLQIYADFSGNMDFILGVSECFGIRLPENFRQPFFSLTIQEFWQRWHISLGSWFKDYVMYPLLRSRLWMKLGKFTKKHFGKKAAKLIPTLLAMLVLWLCNGVWHAPYLKYIATVLWFWFAVSMGQLLDPVGKKVISLLKINTHCFSWRLFQRFRTIAVYAGGVLFFVTPSVMTALRMAKHALNITNVFALVDPAGFFSKQTLALFGGALGAHVLLISILILIGVEVLGNRAKGGREWLSRQNLVFRWIILLGLIFLILLFGIYGPGYNPAEFIYAGF